MSKQRLILALDFGGTKHAAGLITEGETEWLAYRRIPAPHESNGEKDRAAMFALADELLLNIDGELAAIGVSFGGPVNWERGEVILSHHVPGWEATPLRDLLQARYNVPTCMDNDANAAALGEWRYGVGVGCRSLLYITISTGIGGGWVFNGSIHRGADSMAGEIGHLAVDPNGPICVCGKRGCVETIGCGTAIGQEMMAREAGQVRSHTDWVAGSKTAWTGEDVNRAAEAGNPLAIEVMERAAWALGVGIGHAITLMNPEKVVLGGGVTNAGNVYWNKLRVTASQYVLPQMRVDLVKAGLGGDSPLWGAVALAQQALTPGL
jgi:glucokinase